MEHCPPSPTTNSKVLKFTIEHILSKEPCGGSISGTGENSRRDWQSYLSATNFKTSTTSKTLDLSRETSDGANSEGRADPGKSSNRSKLYLRPGFLQCSTDFVTSLSEENNDWAEFNGRNDFKWTVAYNLVGYFVISQVINERLKVSESWVTSQSISQA